MDSREPVVFVVDDDVAICQSVRLLIEDVGLQVRTCGSAQEFLSVYDTSQPGCLVLDVRMAGMSGLELQSRLNELGIQIPTIIITGHGDVQMAVEAMKAGAVDFIEKPFRDQVLLDSIQKAIEVDRHARASHRQCAEFRSRLDRLTERERQIMDRLMVGRVSKEIAFELAISQKTVDFHRSNVLRKLAVGSVVDLVRLAHRAGYLANDLEEPV